MWTNQWEYINRSETHECSNGTVVGQFLFREYKNSILGYSAGPRERGRGYIGVDEKGVEV